MKIKNTLKAAISATTLTILCACNTVADKAITQKATTPSATSIADAKTTKTLADSLSQTKTTAVSADGEMICKRTSVVGSNFKRKVCASADEWEARAAKDRQTVGNIQRSGSGPGTNN